MSRATDAPKFTLRFRDNKSHEVLGIVAERYGVSKNQLLLDMIERELQVAALGVELDLAGTLDLLQGYSLEEHLADAIEAVAQGEAHAQDPLTARRVDSDRDAFGILEAFGA